MRKKRNTAINNKDSLSAKSGTGRKPTPKKAKIHRVARTRNAGTMTESGFWQFIRSALRNKSRWWKPRLKALEKARRSNQSLNKRLKWEFQCFKCLKWHSQTQVEVHHTIPAGQLNSAKDLPDFVEKLFSEQGWECICKKCHKKLHEN